MNRDEEIGMLIQERRNALGLSQEELGQMLSDPVGYGSVSNWERGIKPVPDFRREELAGILGVSVEELSGAMRYVRNETQRLDWIDAVGDADDLGWRAKLVLIRLSRVATYESSGLRFIGSVGKAADAIRNFDESDVREVWGEVVNSRWVEFATDADWDLMLGFPPDA